jgi:hypothetical protein
MSTMKISVEIIRQIDRCRRHCLWHGGDLNDRKPPLVVTVPQMFTRARAQ